MAPQRAPGSSEGASSPSVNPSDAPPDLDAAIGDPPPETVRPENPERASRTRRTPIERVRHAQAYVQRIAEETENRVRSALASPGAPPEAAIRDRALDRAFRAFDELRPILPDPDRPPATDAEREEREALEAELAELERLILELRVGDQGSRETRERLISREQHAGELLCALHRH